MADWKFFLDDIEVNEPSNWDAFEYVLSRSDKYLGLENVYSDDVLEWWAQGAAYITQQFNLLGYDGTIALKIQALCDGIVVDEIDGILNLFFYSEQNHEVKVQFEESEFQRRLKNRLDTPINFDSNKSLDGLMLPAADYFDLKLHSKAIKYHDEMILNTDESIYTETLVLQPNFMTVYFPLTIKINETGGLNEIIDHFQLDNTPVAPNIQRLFVAPFAGTFTFTWHLVGSITLTNYQGTLSFNSGLIYLINSGLFVNLIPVDFHLDTGPPQGRNYNTSGSATITLAKGDTFALVIDVFNIFNNFDYQADVTSINTINTFSVDVESVLAPSSCKAIDIFNAFKRICQSVTGQLDCFRSDYFGRPDIFPFPKTPGCGSYTAITNGLNIRKMLNKNGALFPVSMSFNDLYDAANAVWGIGMRIEFNSYGKAFVRIENQDYFYNSTPVYIFENVSNINRQVAQDTLYNEVEIGFDKWNLNAGGINGIDEFNTLHNYSMPVLNAKKKYEQVSKFIAAGYVIELTRRQQYQDTPTKDFETDDNNFFIATNRTDILKSSTENYYTHADMYTDINTDVYSAGTISERNEDFMNVEKLLSPETAYNLRLSPTRNLLRHYGQLATSIFGKANPIIKFQTGQGNYHERDQMISDACDDVIGQVQQNEDIIKTIVKDPNAIFKPLYLSFETPLTFSQFLDIRKNSQKAIQVSCSTGGLTTTFIKEVRFIPNKEGGIGQFKVLEAVCRLGAFDEGFNEGFDIGTC